MWPNPVSWESGITRNPIRCRYEKTAIFPDRHNIARIAYAVMTTGKPYDPVMGAMAHG